MCACVSKKSIFLLVCRIVTNSINRSLSSLQLDVAFNVLKLFKTFSNKRVPNDDKHERKCISESIAACYADEWLQANRSKDSLINLGVLT